MKLTYQFVFSILFFLSITNTVFSQSLSDKEIGFDIARVTVELKKRGLTDQSMQQEIALLRKVHNKQYLMIKKREDEILQKITSQQALQTETNKTVNTGLTAKTANSQVVDIPQTEKDALLALFNNNNGSNWYNKIGWNFNNPVTSWNSTAKTGWYGITVTDGHITAINLGTNNLKGTIPIEIGQFTQLKTLDLNSDNLTGTIPPQIGQLTQLQNLNLGFNKLNGSIPIEIGQLTQLQNLLLYINQLSGSIPIEIGQLTQLTSLGLAQNDFTGTIPKTIGSLINLQYLGLSYNQLGGTIPIEIGQLTHLQYLVLDANKLNGVIPIQISKLIQLKYLGLTSNQLSGSIPSQIGQLTQLQSLMLSGNQLSGPIPSQIGQLTQLFSLYLGLNQLTGNVPVELAQLTQLYELDLSYNELNHTSFFWIGQFNNLQVLGLNGNRLSGNIPSQIGQLPSLQQLYLSQNQLSGNIDLININRFEELHISQNNFRFVDLANHYSSLKNLDPGSFSYNPQSKTDSEKNITKAIGETQTLIMYEDNRYHPMDTYQWYKNGQIITGATSRQYTLSNLTLANAGDYYCVSTNPQMTLSSEDNQNLILTRNSIHLNVSNCNAVLSSAVGTDNQTVCNSTAITPIAYTTAGLITGATFSGLPNGVTGNFTSNTITISGTPTVSGDFPYTVTYTGDCGSTITSTGTIIILAKTVSMPSATPSICANRALTPITHNTTGGTLTIGTATGLPAGVTAVWASNIVTISGTPTTAGVFNYNIPLLGGCGSVINATGSITVTNSGGIILNSALGTDNQSKKVNTVLTPITYTTTGTTGATIAGLPAGVTGVFASNMVTISGTPTVSGTFNYVISLAGECNTTITGKITSLCEPVTGIIKLVPQICNANVTASQSSQTITSGQTTAITLTSTTVGTTFSWTVVQSGVTGAIAGAGSSINQTLTNAGTTNGTATYTITPVFQNCSGTPIVIVVTVYPILQPPYISLVSSGVCRNVGSCNDNSNCGVKIPMAYYNAPAGSYVTLTVNGSQSASLTMNHISNQFYTLNYLESNAVSASVNFTLYLKDINGNILYYTNQSLSHQSSWAVINICN